MTDPGYGEGIARLQAEAIRAFRVAVVARGMSAVAGFGLVAYGCWLAFPPAGYVVPGVILLAVSIVGHLRGPRRP